MERLSTEDEADDALAEISRRFVVETIQKHPLPRSASFYDRPYDPRAARTNRDAEVKK